MQLEAGELDREHVGDLERILGRITAEDDRAAVIRCARGIYWLYGQMFRGLDAAPVAQRKIA